MKMFLFQSLIWVACPTGGELLRAPDGQILVSIPHMGCMPYGLDEKSIDGPGTLRFNPSYGLHALRALKNEDLQPLAKRFNPSYGLHALRARISHGGMRTSTCFNPSYGLHALRAAKYLQSTDQFEYSFNPSYGLHALRANMFLRPS